MMILKNYWVLSFFLLCFSLGMTADDGHRLWLKYDLIKDQVYLRELRELVKTLDMPVNSAVLKVGKEELLTGISGLMGEPVAEKNINSSLDGQLIIGTLQSHSFFRKGNLKDDLQGIGKEGYVIKSIQIKNKSAIVITARTDIGVLYGVFHFLRLLQTQTDLNGLFIKEEPRLKWRMLNHWDNIDGSVERGYAGMSIWKWDELPNKIDARYKDYARANASIGINGVVLNNVNASSNFLSHKYIKKVAALAEVFRPYGIRVFLSANFASPKVLGNLKTADPLDAQVQKWWKDKTDEIYDLIPDFGGFLVKANSEGQPGPQDFGRSHSEGANMMAKALASHKGMLIWRAFVYKSKSKDRVKEAYNEFAPLDGQFDPNVFLQIKNGPLDFQPREPFSPLFGAMPKTPQMLEFQITQEYLGFSTHLVYLASMFKEALQSDTFAVGKGSTVGRVIDGSVQNKKQKMTGISGVANIGDDKNWTGHPFGQANWYAFGRLAWNHDLSEEKISEEWIKMTLTQDPNTIRSIKNMMLNSYEHIVNSETPLGLNVLASPGHHYGPRPWKRQNYHHADNEGLGFDRTRNGSNAVAQYFPEVQERFENIETCPERLLTWFHHVSWDYKMNSDRIFWEELCYKYYKGVEGVRQMQQTWGTIKNKIDPQVFSKVSKLLVLQEDEAVWWRDANLWYFQKHSGLQIPKHYEEPRYDEIDFKQKEKESKKLKHYSKQ